MCMLASVALAGCASFSESHLPARSLAEFEAGGRLAAITYQFSEWNVATSDEGVVLTTAAAVAMPSVVRSRIEPILRRAFVDCRRGTEQGEWHLDMYYRETKRNVAVSMTLAWLCIVSLGIVPAYEQTDLYFEARLLHSGQPVKQYVYEETISLWITWLLLPWSFSDDPTDRKAEILDNMVLNLIHDVAAEVPRATPAVAVLRP